MHDCVFVFSLIPQTVLRVSLLSTRASRVHLFLRVVSSVPSVRNVKLVRLGRGVRGWMWTVERV